MENTELDSCPSGGQVSFVNLLNSYEGPLRANIIGVCNVEMAVCSFNYLTLDFPKHIIAMRHFVFLGGDKKKWTE